MSRITRAFSLTAALALSLACGTAMAVSDKGLEHSKGFENANPNAGGFSNPNSALYDNVSQVPEPSALFLAIAGAGVVAWTVRRRGK